MTHDASMSGIAALIVDDSVVNQKLARVLLQSVGCDVRVAASGDEMFEVLRTFRPHVILMDIQLPQEDGLQLTRRLKADPATRSIVVIAVTAYAMKGDEERAAAAGCDGYITKPIDTRVLPRFVMQRLAERGDDVAPPQPGGLLP